MVVHRHKDRKRDRHLYYYEFQFMGVRRKKSGFLNEYDAERAEIAAKEKIRKMKNGEYEIEEDFNDYIEGWLTRRRDLGENTRANYFAMLRNHILPFFEGHRVNTVKAIHVKNFIDHLHDKGLGSSGLRKNYNVINKMFNELVRMEMLPFNPCNAIDKPTERRGEDRSL